MEPSSSGRSGEPDGADEIAPLRNPAAAPVQLLDLAELNVPILIEAINAYSRSLEQYVPRLRTAAAHPAILVVGIMGINDFNDLLFDSVSGRGRSALRVSRTLFEHLLNLLSFEDEEARDRFMAHYVVTVELATRWNPVGAFLRGKALKGARHRQKRIARDNKPDLNAALAEYGPAFLRGWHPATTRDRAINAGMEREYEFFRSSSAAVHGTAGASQGSFWLVDGEPLVRVGPSVIECPVALSAGVLIFSRFVEALEELVNLGSLSLTGAIRAIGTQIQEFCDYTNGLEQYLFGLDGLERPSLAPQVLRFPHTS